MAFLLFPAYGGFSRQIIFVKPDNKSNSAGYFIIVDELAPDSRKYNIDWLLHSRGNLKIHSDGQSLTYTVKSYISNDDISLRVSFLENIEEISEHKGYFLPYHYSEDYPYDDLEISYIKATYSGNENPIMATVLYPKNNSDGSQQFPEIKRDDSGLRYIGDNDFLYYNLEINNIEFSDPDIYFDGKLFFIRKNMTSPNLLEYFYAQKSKNLKFKGTEYFSASDYLEYIVVNYENNSQISGCLKANKDDKDVSIELYCPFTVQTFKIDGIDASFSQDGSKIIFEISGAKSFVISSTSKHYNPEYDYLRDDFGDKKMPKESDYEFNLDLIKSLTHPYSLYNLNELVNIRKKINDTNKVWNNWYKSYTSDVDNIKKPEEIDPESRYYYIYKLALKFVIDSGNTYLDKIKDFLDVMGEFQNYSQDLRRAYAVQAYATVLDLIYANLSSSEQKKYEEYLYQQAEPLTHMDLYPDNNHCVVDAGGLGMAGLVLKNESMINIAIKTILNYYYTKNPKDGGSYEGYSYNAFAMDEIMKFAVSLKRLGGYNLFENEQILATFDFMAETLGPLGMPSLYEDCTFSSRLQEVLLVAAANLNNTYPEKAAHYQYIWEQRQNNTKYESKSSGYYTYLNGGSSNINRILLYNLNNSIKAEPFKIRREVWKESSMAFLRSSEEPNALFLSFSCKNYYQSHTHYDENSFEIWAYGAYIANNPGYPGWGSKHHDWTISTEASNTLLIAGSGQLQNIGEGLNMSFSSPYLSVVVGSAMHIYDDPGSFKNAFEFYALIFLAFILLGVSVILFFLIAKNRNREVLEDKLNSNEEEDIEDRQLNLSKGNLIKLVFIHPKQAQEYVFHEDPYRDNATFMNRVIKLILSGLIVIFFIIAALDTFTVINYHTQYYEYKYKWLIDLIPYLEWGILIIGSILGALFCLLILGIYNRLNTLLAYKALENFRTDLTRKKIKFISISSTIFQIPVLIFAFLLIYFTTGQSFKEGIRLLFTGLGSINEIYMTLLSVLLEFIRNFFIILIFEIPFLILTARTFGYGLELNTYGLIPKSKARNIAIISILIVIVFIIISFSIFYILTKMTFSLISIEASTK
ncbi:MAG: heparinase II/III domain-containing protein [Promethearchaeota archaeon]